LQLFQEAKKAVNAFAFIGIQEVFDFSVKVFLHEINHVNQTYQIVNERDQGNAKEIVKKKSDIKSNNQLMDKARRMNNFDLDLYELGA
jgi:hypothetical protein